MIIAAIGSLADGFPEVASRDIRQFRDGRPDELVEQLGDGLGPNVLALSADVIM